MKTRMGVLLIGAIVLGPWARADHATGGPAGERPHQEPCTEVEGDVQKRILTEAEKKIAKLYVASALFAARYKEVGETPAVKDLQRRTGYLGSPEYGRLVSGGHALAFAGTAFLLASGRGFSSKPLVPGQRTAAGAYLGSAVSSLAGASYSWERRDRLVDKSNREVLSNAASLKKHVNEGVAEATALYGELFRWDGKQKETFHRLLNEEAVKVLERASDPRFGDRQRVQAVLDEVDPIKILTRMHPDRGEEIKALEGLRELQKNAEKTGPTRFDLPAGTTLDRHLKALATAARVYEMVNRDLPPGSDARKEGERLLAEIRESERAFRELCELNRR